MAHIDVVKFIDQVIGDAALQAKLRDIRAANDEEAMEQLIRIASHFGCSFQESDLDEGPYLVRGDPRPAEGQVVQEHERHRDGGEGQ